MYFIVDPNLLILGIVENSDYELDGYPEGTLLYEIDEAKRDSYLFLLTSNKSAMYVEGVVVESNNFSYLKESKKFQAFEYFDKNTRVVTVHGQSVILDTNERSSLYSRGIMLQTCNTNLTLRTQEGGKLILTPVQVVQYISSIECNQTSNENNLYRIIELIDNSESVEVLNSIDISGGYIQLDIPSPEEGGGTLTN